MIRLIELLREEHRSMEELLLVMEGELSIFDQQERPDYELLQAVIGYFRDYPDCSHHPKEDMIFEKLKALSTVAAERVGDLEAEHRDEAIRLRRVEDMIRNILLDHDIMPRQGLVDAVHDFVEQERLHIKMEERLLFPVAAEVLRPEDWAEIESRWSDTQASLFNIAMEEKCQSLHDRVLQWAREAKGNRG
jgi:hemerythrin-like domain-containing protein